MTTDADVVVAIRNHLFHSREYFDSAAVLLQQGEAGKSGELFWGSLAQAFHALAAYKGQQLKTHRDLKNFAIQLARELQDDKIRDDFLLAEYLHFNFYVVDREAEDIMLVLPAVEELRQKVLGLVPRDITEYQPDT